MWTNTTMTLAESLVASAMGFLIVFLVLIFLALVIILFAKFLDTAAVKKKEMEQPAPAAVIPEKDDSEIVSIVTSVICEELKVQPHELRINGIREV